MTLKKSDKIIAIIGVIILIVAAVGIYAYAGVEEDKEPSIMDENKFFEVHYEEKFTSAIPDNTDYSIKPKLIGSNSYEGIVQISQPNINLIDINIEYSDNKAGFLPIPGLIKSIGADTITIVIYDSQDNEIGREKIKGSGNKTLNIKTNGDKILMDPIEADNLEEAMTKLQDRYIDFSETYTIRISLKTGLWGKIRELLGKDSFDLDITYSYYYYYLMQKENGDDSDGNGDDDMPPTGENQGSQTWSPMAYPGKN
jgi:hypothetical protein